MRNRNKAVTTRISSFPVLISCDRVKRDGHLRLRPGVSGVFAVRTFSTPQVAQFWGRETRPKFEREYGSISRKDERLLKGLFHLVQAIKNNHIRKLGDYAQWRAGEKAGDELEKWFELLGWENADWERYKNATHRGTLIGPPKDAGLPALGATILAEVKADPAREFAIHVNSRIAKVRPVVWWDRREQQIAPGLYCRDTTTALFCQLVATLDTPQGWAVCARPTCGKPFIRSRRTQQYCSLRCGAAGRMAHMRQRKAQALRTRKRKREGQ
jgi:hypothetical protein